MRTVLGLLMCAAALAAALLGLFRVQTVQVVGANVPQDTVAQAANVRGKNIFTLRSDGIVQRLDAWGQIAVRRVDISLPNRVTIYAAPRPALAAWQHGPTLYEVDGQGKIIRPVRTTSLPVVSGATGNRELGQDIVQAVRYAMQVLPQSPYGTPQSFRVDPTTGLVVIGRAGWTAVVGRGQPQQTVDRVATLAKFLKKIGDRASSLTFVDLRYRVPYARFRGS